MTTTAPDYSKASLMRFFDVVVDQGLMNPNTARGWSAACSRILEDIPDANDVRSIDVLTAVKRYHNKHPGQLKGTVLKEYQRRLTTALADFTMISGFDRDITQAIANGAMVEVDPTGERPFIRVARSSA